MPWRNPILPDDIVTEHSKLDLFFEADLENVAEAVLREASQNTGDAAEKEGKQVRLCFRFVKVEDSESFSPFLEGLRPHLEASGIDLSGLDLERPNVLLIEDFGTTGLLGPVDDPDSKAPFARFWRVTGASSKTGDAGGRHGVGKITYNLASRIKTVFGLSIRYADGHYEAHLMGRAVLKPHVLDGHRRHGLGTYARPSDEGRLPLPFEGQDALDFADVLGLSRGGEEPGLSIAILVPDEEVTSEGLVRAAVAHCQYQIVSGLMVVEVGDVVINGSTIDDIIANDPGLAHLESKLRLSREAIGMDPSEFFVPTVEALESRLSPAVFASEDVQALRAHWALGSVIGLRMPFNIKPISGAAETGHLQLFLMPEDEKEKAGATFVRRDITIPQGGKFGGQEAVGLLVAEAGPAATFLGDAEPPSHISWQEMLIKKDYERPRVTLGIAKYALADLYALITEREEEGEVPHALTEFFFKETTAGARKKGELTKEFRVEVSPRQQPFNITKLKSPAGFKVSLTDNGKKKAPISFNVKTAYLLRKANPFKKYRPADFKIAEGGIEMKHSGEVASVTINENSVLVQDASAEFEITVAGFDAHRDIVVKVEETS